MATKRKNTRRAVGRPVGVVHEFDVAVQVGNEDHAVDGRGVGLRVGRDGRAFFVPVALRGASEDQLDLLHLAQELVREHVDVLDRLDRCVELMRQEGLSWASIAWCVGLTEAGARKRWGSCE